MSENNKSVIVLDTDVGLDDAAAILLAKHSNLNVDYYVCTEGNTSVEGIARNVFILNKYLDLNAYIVSGCSSGNKEIEDYYGLDGLANLSEQMMKSLDIDANDVKVDMSYDDFKRELLKYNHITYIAISPLVTLSNLIQNEDIKNRIDEVYVMGGGINTFNAPGDTEYNFSKNPEAVRKILSSGLHITLFPLDLTIKQCVNKEQIDKLEETQKYPEFIKMLQFIKKQNLEYDNIDAAVLHDTMPILYCKYAEKFETENVKVVCDSNGHLDIVDTGYKITLVTNVDSSLLSEEMEKVFGVQK